MLPKKLCSEIPQKNRLDIFEKRKVPQQFNIEHNKNEKIVTGQWKIAGQWTIAANLPLHEYPTII